MLESRIIKHLAFLDYFSKDSLYSFETFTKATEILKYKNGLCSVVCSPPKHSLMKRRLRQHTAESDMQTTQDSNRMKSFLTSELIIGPRQLELSLHHTLAGQAKLGTHSL